MIAGAAIEPSKRIALKVLCLLVVLSMSLPGYLPFLPSPTASAQTDPPPFGIGNWIINDNTVIKDQTMVIQGSIAINSGGSLTLDNTKLQLHLPSDYAYSITVNAGGSLYIQNHSFVGTTDKLFILTAAPGSKLRISNTSLNGLGAVPLGSSDAIIEWTNITGNQPGGSEGIVVLTGNTIIRNTTITFTYDAIWDAEGEVSVYDTTIYDAMAIGIKMFTVCTEDAAPFWMPAWFDFYNPARLYCTPAYNHREAHLANNHLQWVDRAGIRISYATVEAISNTITFVTGPAIQIEELSSNALIKDNEIYDDWYGIVVKTSFNEQDQGAPYFPSNIELVNNNITKMTYEALVVVEPVRVHWSWEFNDHPSIIDAPIQVKLPINISDGGQLTLRNTTLGMFGTSIKPYGITIKDKGTLDLEGVTMELVNRSRRGAFLQAQPGSTVHISNSTLDGLGYDWGATGETAGVYSGGLMTIDNSTVENGYDCLIIDGGITTVRSSHLINCTDGLRVLSGNIEVYDSGITRMSGLDVKVDDGLVDLYNSTFNVKRYVVQKGTLNVLWQCDLQTMWENSAALGNASFNISEKDGKHVLSGQTGLTGLSDEFYLREFTDVGSGKDTTTPHNVSGSFKGMTNSTDVYILLNTRIPLYLPDHIKPNLKVMTPPSTMVYQKNNSLFVNGTAWDNESGIDRVQWSLDNDLWTDVNGLAKWNFTIKLKFGSYDLYVRARDRAGNIANVTLHVTIDISAPYLYVLSPANNFTTKLMTVLVEGATEPGATVTIKGQSMLSIDGTFRMSVPIVEGVNLLLVSVKDPTGNTNSTTVRVIRKTTPPKIIITYPPDNLFTNRLDQQNLPVTGLTDPGVKLMSQDRLVNVNDDGSFSFTYGLKEGMNEIYLLAEDPLGNQNSSLRHVTFDITIPSLNITSPKDGFYTNQTSVSITGTTKTMATVTARTLNFTASTQADPDGRFEMKIRLSEGPNIIQLMAKDRANNTKTGMLTVNRDTVGPTIKLNGVKDGMVSELAYVIVEGQTEVGAHIKLNGEIIPVGITGNFGATLNLTSANNTFVFEATDRAGNTNAMTVHVKLKAPPEPKPTGAAAAMDFIPWLALVAVIVLVVQWTFLTRHNYLKAKKSGLDKAAAGKEEGSKKGPIKEQAGPPQRMMPRRPPKEAPIVVEEGAPEFEIEYGNGDGTAPGGGRR
jgi:hypothetical protein